MNTHEQFITLETAKLLKQAGFDWEVKTFYIPNTTGNKLHYDDWYPDWNDKENIDPTMAETFPAPTQAVAMRWLREVKDIDVEVMRCIDVKVYNAIYVYHGETIIIKHLPTYEQAAEAGIQECLKVILKEQSNERRYTKEN